MMRALLIALLIVSPAHAQDPFGGPIETPSDSPLSRWFKTLQRPDNHLRPPFEETNEPTSCCDAGDVVKTTFKVESRGSLHPQDTWFAWLKGKWVRIPPEKIVPDYAPDGQAYLFMLTIANAYEIVCFVRPNGGL